MSSSFLAAFSRQNVTILTFSDKTTGSEQIRMGLSAHSMLAAAVTGLKKHTVHNILILTNSKFNGACDYAEQHNVFCTYDDIDEPWPVHTGGSLIPPYHPYRLFLHRWEVTSKLLRLGCNVLSIDTDVIVNDNPWRHVYHFNADLLFQLDSGWPVRGQLKRTVRTDERGQKMYVLRIGEEIPRPLVNSGFVWANGANNMTSVIFSELSRRIRTNMNALLTSSHESHTKLVKKTMWSQHIFNSILEDWATGWHASRCHAHFATRNATDLLATARISRLAGLKVVGLPRSFVSRVCAAKMKTDEVSILQQQNSAAETLNLKQMYSHAQFMNTNSRLQLFRISGALPSEDPVGGYIAISSAVNQRVYGCNVRTRYCQRIPNTLRRLSSLASCHVWRPKW